MKQRTTALLLAAALLLCLLSGCGSKNTPEAAAPAVTSEPAAAAPAETAVPTAEPEPTDDPEGDSEGSPYEMSNPLECYELAADAYPGDTVVLKVNGEEFTWDEYYSWIYSMISQLMQYYYSYGMGLPNWDDELYEGMTFQDYAKLYAEAQIAQYAVVGQEAERLGIELDNTKVEEMLQRDADAYYDGSVETMLDTLKDVHMPEHYYRYLCSASVLCDDLFDHYYGLDGGKLSDTDAVSYIDELGYLHAKHILFLTVDNTTGEPLEEEAVSEKKAQAEDLLAQLKKCSVKELEEQFTKLMNEYSEDPGSTVYPDGYYFSEGEMVEEFEEAVKALNENEMTPELVETSYGYHIIMRPAIHADDLFDYDEDGTAGTVRFCAASALFNELMAELAADSEIVYDEDFTGMEDFTAFFAQFEA